MGRLKVETLEGAVTELSARRARARSVRQDGRRAERRHFVRRRLARRRARRDSRWPATCVTHEQCKDNADVTLCTVQDGGHTWPGGFASPGLGKTTNDIRATDALWDFFQTHPMP